MLQKIVPTASVTSGLPWTEADVKVPVQCLVINHLLVLGLHSSSLESLYTPFSPQKVDMACHPPSRCVILTNLLNFYASIFSTFKEEQQYLPIKLISFLFVKFV